MEISFLIFQILKSWWWLFLSVILWFPAKTLYLWWIRWEVWYPKFKWILLEIKPPKEILKPFSAMENLFSMLWGIIDAPNWRERWCAGELPLGGGLWFSFEICSFGGEIHFYIRIPEFFRNATESAIYSQYPDAEISLVEDYTKNVPKNIPNEKWDLYSEDYTLANPDHYPIKTYSMFFEKEAEEKRVMEEKRIDPLDPLLEGLSKFQSGEQIWLQIVCNPIIESTFPWIAKGREAANKIARRPAPKKPKPIIQEAAEILISGPPKKEEKPMELIAPELRLTPGEKEILTAIENKIKKPAYQCWIRQVYLCKKDEPHNSGNYKLIREYLMSQFSTSHLNRLTYFGGTRTRIHYWLKARRLYLRKRQQLRRYIERVPSLWPRTMIGSPLFPGPIKTGPGSRTTCILNIEELATIFHFPAKIITLALAPVEAKKGGPPPELPVE
jgi:hypothetical protein